MGESMMEAHVTTGTQVKQPSAQTLTLAPGDPKPDGPQDEGFVLKIKGKAYDATDLTLNEVEQIEDLCGGASLDTLDLGRAKTLKAIVYVLLRRDEPEITLEQAGNIKLSGLLGADPE